MANNIPNDISFSQSGNSVFEIVYIYDKLYVEAIEVSGGSINIDELNAKRKLTVGTSGTVFNAQQGVGVGVGTISPRSVLDVNGNLLVSGNIGVGTTAIPEQRIDIDGSIKIDENIYDSVNSPGEIIISYREMEMEFAGFPLPQEILVFNYRMKDLQYLSLIHISEPTRPY